MTEKEAEPQPPVQHVIQYRGFGGQRWFEQYTVPIMGDAVKTRRAAIRALRQFRKGDPDSTFRLIRRVTTETEIIVE